MPGHEVRELLLEQAAGLCEGNQSEARETGTRGGGEGRGSKKPWQVLLFQKISFPLRYDIF